MLPLETKQSGGKLLPHSDFWGGGCFKGNYQAGGATARISHITSTKLEEHTKVAAQKCHQSAPNEDVLETLLQNVLFNAE